MDISALSTSLNQSTLSLKVGVAVTKLAIDSAEIQSQDMVRMMEQSVNPNIGQNIDVKI